MTISAIFSKLFILLILMPDFSTLVAILLVCLTELCLNYLKMPSFMAVAYFFTASVLTVISLKDFLVNAIYPTSSDAFFSVTLILALIFAVVSGKNGVVRGFLIVSFFFVISFLFTVFGNIPQFSNPQFSLNIIKVIKDFLIILIFSPEILFFERKRGKSYIIVSNLLLILAVFITILVLGRVASETAYPYYTAGTIAKISVFSRLDAVHSALWVMLGYFKGGLLLNACKDYFTFADTSFKLLHKNCKSSGQGDCSGDRN